MYEYFTNLSNGKWVRSLHYAGTEVSLGGGHSLDFFYMYHLYNTVLGPNACNLLGIGYTLVF